MTGRLPCLALAGLVACGVKSRPVAPELVQPQPPGNLAAIASPEGVKLTWIRPLSYRGGRRMNDLGGFTVERAAADDAPPAFATVATIPVQDQERFRKDRRVEWLDRTAAPGTRYLYRVTCYTLDDYVSPPAGPVAVRFGSPSAKESAP
jgi:hypothetical protein